MSLSSGCGLSPSPPSPVRLRVGLGVAVRAVDGLGPLGGEEGEDGGERVRLLAGGALVEVLDRRLGDRLGRHEERALGHRVGAVHVLQLLMETFLFSETDADSSNLYHYSNTNLEKVVSGGNVEAERPGGEVHHAVAALPHGV